MPVGGDLLGGAPELGCHLRRVGVGGVVDLVRAQEHPGRHARPRHGPGAERLGGVGGRRRVAGDAVVEEGRAGEQPVRGVIARGGGVFADRQGVGGGLECVAQERFVAGDLVLVPCRRHPDDLVPLLVVLLNLQFAVGVLVDGRPQRVACQRRVQQARGVPAVHRGVAGPRLRVASARAHDTDIRVHQAALVVDGRIPGDRVRLQQVLQRGVVSGAVQGLAVGVGELQRRRGRLRSAGSTLVRAHGARPVESGAERQDGGRHHTCDPSTSTGRRFEPHGTYLPRHQGRRLVRRRVRCPTGRTPRISKLDRNEEKVTPSTDPHAVDRAPTVRLRGSRKH